MPTSLYSLLGLTTEATKAQIRKAYLRKALKTHPDRKTTTSEGEGEEFKAIKHAYEVLFDDDRRREYDLRPPTPPPDTRSRPQSRPNSQAPSFSRPSRSNRTTFSPSARHSFHSYPSPTPNGSDSSEGEETQEDGSLSTDSEPDEPLPPHPFRPSHGQHEHHHQHAHAQQWDYDEESDDQGDDELLDLARKEAEWAKQDRFVQAQRESIREGLRKGGRTASHGLSRPSSPTEDGRSRPSAAPRARSYAPPSQRDSRPSSPYYEDDDFRSVRDERRSFPPAEGRGAFRRRERMGETSENRTRPPSPERVQPRAGDFPLDPRVRRGPSYEYLSSPSPMPPANFNRPFLPPLPPQNYGNLRAVNSPLASPLQQPSSRSRVAVSWTAKDYTPSPKAYSGPPPSSYFPAIPPPSSRQQQQRASTSPIAFPSRGPLPFSGMTSPRAKSTPVPRVSSGRSRSGEMGPRRR